MDMRLLLVRGDMGDAESLPASPRAGLSPRRISRQEPEEGDDVKGGWMRWGDRGSEKCGWVGETGMLERREK